MCDYFSPTKAGKHFLIETEDRTKGKTDYSEDKDDEDEPPPGKSLCYWLDYVEWGAFEFIVIWSL